MADQYDNEIIDIVLRMVGIDAEKRPSSAMLYYYFSKEWTQGLMEACKEGCIEFVKLMISNGADDWDEGLSSACGEGHIELAKLMISKGADRWDWGLCDACRGGHIELVE